jgi:hypothetical protein
MSSVISKAAKHEEAKNCGWWRCGGEKGRKE